MRSSTRREELTLTKKLLEAFEKPKFSLASYKDHYVEELRELIEAKVEGKEMVAPPEREEPHVINLMDALKKSVAAAKGNGRTSGNGSREAGRSGGGRRREVRRRRQGRHEVDSGRSVIGHAAGRISP